MDAQDPVDAVFDRLLGDWRPPEVLPGLFVARSLGVPALAAYRTLGEVRKHNPDASDGALILAAAGWAMDVLKEHVDLEPLAVSELRLDALGRVERIPQERAALDRCAFVALNE